MSDFELGAELSTSLLESRPILLDKTEDIYKERNETKMVQMSDFELGAELSTSLVESRPIFSEKRTIIIKKEMKQKWLRKEWCR